MKVKILEIRDTATFIGVLCVDMQPDNDVQRYYMRRVGYPCDGRPNVVITKVQADGDRASNDPYYWGDRTMQAAHEWITDHWNELEDGAVIDVQYILGETGAPKQSERAP